MSLLSLMNKTLNLERLKPIGQRGGSGAQAPSLFTPDNAATCAPCSIQPASASVKLQYMQRRMTVSHTLYFDQDWKVFLGDRWVDCAGQRVFVVRGWYNSLELDDTWVCDAEETRVPLSPGVPTS